MELSSAITTAEKDASVKKLVGKGAFLCSAYVMLDPNETITSWNLNYFVPTTGKITPVLVSEKGVEVGEADAPVREKEFKPFGDAKLVDGEEALRTGQKLADEQKVRPTKTIVSLQKDDMEYWSVTFLTREGEALNVRIDAHTNEVLLTEKSNLLQRDKSSI